MLDISPGLLHLMIAKVLWSSSNSMALICFTNITQDTSYTVSKKDMTDKSSENKLKSHGRSSLVGCSPWGR